jgi:probable rRNA maturation factor
LPVLVTRRAAGSEKLDARAVKRRAERMLVAIGSHAAELSIVLTGDEQIEALNRTHRRKAKPTDVLAFPMDPAGAGPSRKIQLLGDVVISLDTAARQARARRRPLMAEVTHLLAHGILHLAGYDHKTDAQERRMNEATRLLVESATGRGPMRAILLAPHSK